MFCPDFVGLYGLDHSEESLEALKYLTVYSSSEFAVREFLIRDRKRTLAAMKRWSTDQNHHVRRLSSEGSRPRLPWSFKLTEFIADPSLTKPILVNLRADESLYVRKSVANHLNDISKDHPEWMLDLVSSWDRADEPTKWIIKRAARTLVKAGHPRVVSVFGIRGSTRSRTRSAGPEQAAVATGIFAAFPRLHQVDEEACSETLHRLRRSICQEIGKSESKGVQALGDRSGTG